MAPTVDNATLIILDIGQHTSASAEKNEKPFFENARQCAMRIIEKNIMIQTRNHVGVILLGANKTKNALAEQCPGAFKRIEMTAELQPPTWQMIRDLPQAATSRKGDWFEALVVAAHHYKDGVSGVKINSKKIVLLTNFEAPANVGKNFQEVVEGFKEDELEVFVIGVDIEEQHNKDLQLIRQLVEATNGDTATFSEAFSGWMFHKTRGNKMTPQNFDLSFGPNIKIPISAYIRIRDEAVVKNWQKAIKDPVTATASSNEGIQKERKTINTENQKVIKPEDIIKGYLYGQKVIPFSDTDKENLYQSGDRSFSIYGFTSANNIQWQNLQGDGTYYVFGRKNDKKALYAITCLVECLHEKNLVGLARKVHSRNTEPKMFLLAPVFDPNGSVCLSMIRVCYKEEIKNMTFPPTELKKFACSDAQVNAFKELIKSMDLTKAYDESYGDTEAFPVAETVSPAIQYILDCISYRALNPGKPLPQPRDEIMTLFKVPPLIEKQSRDPIENLKKLFLLTKIEKKVKRRGGAVPNTGISPTINNATDNKMDVDDVPKVHLPIIKNDEVTSVGTDDPVKDFEKLLGEGKSLVQLAAEMTEVIEGLVYTNFGGDFSKPLQALKRFRTECVKSEPSHYNNWLLKFKKDLLDRKKDTFLELLSEEGKFISKYENSTSTFTQSDEHGDSQMYDNDTIPNSTELAIDTDVNDLFDEM
ncbi:hypothetical protein JYU34_001899 [Plutella xylostella]|uniref:VWFA domain-containing protein n=1 Tax=Plutella xylostella TaxID=51655 RepID=A0ABQ7R554_PLUXY|nr:hypothetical protein JYU34_001899 [Plutella xylostella]